MVLVAYIPCDIVYGPLTNLFFDINIVVHFHEKINFWYKF